MAHTAKKIAARFFATRAGNQPVRAWLLELSSEDRKLIGEDIAVAEFGWPVGMPICKSLGHGLWEIRSDISDNKIARVIFMTCRDEMVLLHGFIKKTKQTPKIDLDLAAARKREFEHATTRAG